MKMEDGMIKYKCLPELVKMPRFYHVERSLSVNTSVVTEDRPHIGEATFCAIRTVKDAVEFCAQDSNQPQKFPLTRELLRSAKIPTTDKD